MTQIINSQNTPSEESPCPLTTRAYFLLSQGQAELEKNDLEKALLLFQEASELKPLDPKLYFEQGLSLFSFASVEGHEKTLLLACKKCKLSISLFPEFFEAWNLWGKALFLLGKTYEESHYFSSAEEKLMRAIELSKDVSAEVLANLYFDYALVKASLAKRSTEAYDWQISIDAFEKASALKTGKTANFWIQFGLTCLSLTELLVDIKLCVKTIQCFKTAITQTPNNYPAWKSLCKAMCFLYSRTHDEDHFTQTSECFNTCIQLNPLDIEVHLDWASFLLQSGKITEDVKRLKTSIEKSQTAYSLHEKNADCLACWGEALALLGEKTEEIELIHEGQNKVIEAVDLKPESPLIWRALGETFNSLARYFEDCDYHYQAIEKFQEGLSLDSSKHELWFAIGSTYHMLGKMLFEEDSLEKSLRFYQKAINLQPLISQYRFNYACCLSFLGEVSQTEEWLDLSINEFEKALQIQKNAIYMHSDWLFEYAKALDLYAEFFEEERHYQKAIEIFSHVLMIDPDFPSIHYHLALTHSHLGELLEEPDSFYRALHFFKLAAKHDPENDQILVDLGVTLMNIAEISKDSLEKETCLQDAEAKLTQAAKAGNIQSYYQIACVFSLQNQVDKAIAFLLKADAFHALPAIEDLFEDDWLEPIRSSIAFNDLIDYLEKKESLQEDR